MKSSSSYLSKLVLSLHLAKDEKGAQRVLLVIGIVGVLIAVILFFSLSHSSRTVVPPAQLQQTISTMKETSVPIRSHT